MSQIKDDLQKILLALKGEVIASEKLEKVQYAIQIQKIPESWLANSYPSIKSLAGYIKDLLNRLKMFQQWIEFSNPKIYWFSGFFFPQAFLTAIL
jgi:dynein heavy chain